MRQPASGIPGVWPAVSRLHISASAPALQVSLTAKSMRWSRGWGFSPTSAHVVVTVHVTVGVVFVMVHLETLQRSGEFFTVVCFAHTQGLERFRDDQLISPCWEGLPPLKGAGIENFKVRNRGGYSCHLSGVQSLLSSCLFQSPASFTLQPNLFIVVHFLKCQSLA